MAKLIAEGNLSTLNEFADLIDMQEMFTGALGIMLSGAFGTGSTVIPYMMKPGSTNYSFRYMLPVLSPADSGAAVTGMSMTAAGLYYWSGTIDMLTMRLTANEPGVTDIDWKVYVRPRP